MDECQMTHHYTVDRRIWYDRGGNTHQSAYWKLICDCGWRGRRITQPGSGQSKERMREWEQHLETV